MLIVCVLLQTARTYSQISYRTIVTRISQFPSNKVAAWSNAFDDKISDKINIVGLGEFTHGGHETFVAKCEIVQYLIENKGYRRLLLEFPNVILTELNDYLLKKSPGSSDSTLRLIKHAYAGVIKDSSFYDLLVWLKQYNATHINDMVSLKGVDIEGSDSAFTNYFLYNYLLVFDNKNAVDIIARVGSSKDSLVAAELNWYDKSKDRLKQNLGEASYNELLYNVRNAKDKIAHKSINTYNRFKASVFRDSVMAQNVVYLATEKSILLAHNLHISTSNDLYSTGKFLRAMVGNKYFSILTDFSDEALVWVISDKNMLMKKHFKSFNKTIAATVRRESQIDEGIVFFDDLTKMKATTFTNSIDKNGRQQIFGRGQPFDALIFFNKVTPCL